MSEKGVFIKNFPHKYYTRSLKTITDDLEKDLKSKIPDSSTKLNKFMEAYEEFKKTGFSKRLHLDDFVESQVLYIMRGPLILYTLNMSGQLLIDLAGLLERYAIIYIEELFKSLRSIQLFPAALCVIEEMMEKKFLDELTKHLVTLEIWDKEDIKQVNKLYKKRNLVAHKNTKKIQAFLNSGTTISVPEIDLAISTHSDVLPYMFITIRLLSKLIGRSVEKIERYRIAKAIIDNKISNEAEFFSMNF